MYIKLFTQNKRTFRYKCTQGKYKTYNIEIVQNRTRGNLPGLKTSDLR